MTESLQDTILRLLPMILKKDCLHLMTELADRRVRLRYGSAETEQCMICKAYRFKIVDWTTWLDPSGYEKDTNDYELD